MARNLIKLKGTSLHLDKFQTTSQPPLFALHRPVSSRCRPSLT